MHEAAPKQRTHASVLLSLMALQGFNEGEVNRYLILTYSFLRRLEITVRRCVACRDKGRIDQRTA